MSRPAVALGQDSSAARSSGLRNGVQWRALADGRVHRLKRGKHFEGAARALATEAAAAAAEMDLAVRTVRDELGQRSYLWLQFADQRLPVGAPCARCGSRRLERLHEHFARCPACGASIIVEGELDPQDREGAENRPSKRPRYKGFWQERSDYRLESFFDLRLEPYEVEEDRERWRGHAVDRYGDPVLLLVEYPLGEDGARQHDDQGRDVCDVWAWPAGPFEDALDLEALRRTAADAGG